MDIKIEKTVKMIECESRKILSSIKAKRKLAEMVKQLFQNSEMLETTQGLFIQERQLNFRNNHKLCGVLICPTPILYSPALWQP